MVGNAGFGEPRLAEGGIGSAVVDLVGGGEVVFEEVTTNDLLEPAGVFDLPGEVATCFVATVLFCC